MLLSRILFDFAILIWMLTFVWLRVFDGSLAFWVCYLGMMVVA